MTGTISSATFAARPRRIDAALLVAGSAAFSISTMFSAMKPVLISRFVEQAGYSPSLAGLAAAMPFIGGVVSSPMLPRILRRISAGAAVIGFSIALALIEVANALWFGVPALLLFGQFAGGICGGVLLGLVSRLIAISAQPEQSFGIVDMVGVLMMSFTIAAVGNAVERDGLRGGFLAASGLCMVVAAAMIFARGKLPAIASGPADAGTGAPLAITWRAVTIIAMGTAFVTFSGLGFAFMVTAARKLGFSYEHTGSVIGVILFVSASGCLVGGWCAARFGSRAALLGAFALCALGWHVAFDTHSQTTFVLALGPAVFALQFCFPILLALAGSVDAEGRVAAIAAPLIVSGFAWAAILAGIVVNRWGLTALPIVTELGMVCCAVLLLVGTRPNQKAPSRSAEEPVIRRARH